MSSIGGSHGSNGAPQTGDHLEAGLSGGSYRALLGYFRRRLPQSGIDCAEDLCQEAMLAAWLGAVNGAQDVRSPGHYLRGIALHKLCDQLRWEYRRPVMNTDLLDLRPGIEPRSEDDPELRLMAAESRAALLRALERLPAPEDRLLRLCLFEGYTHGEACRRIGIPKKDGSRMKYRAIRKLRTMLQARRNDNHSPSERRRPDHVTLTAFLFPNNPRGNA